MNNHHHLLGVNITRKNKFLKVINMVIMVTFILNMISLPALFLALPLSADANTKALASEEEQALPILQITKEVNAEYANPGDTVTYTVVITNVGSEAAINLTLTEVLPSNFSFINGGKNTKTFKLGNLAMGESVTKTYEVAISEDSGAGTYTNTATAEADNHNPISAQANLEVKLLEVLEEEINPNLSITKETNVEYANPGNVVEYTITVVNNGDGEAINVVLTDQLPEGFFFDGTTDSVKAWEVGNITPAEQKTITYAVKIGDNSSAGTYNNTAIVNAENDEEKTTQASLEIREIAVRGATLEETGTSYLDYLFYLVGTGILSLSLWIILKKREEIK